MHGFRALLTALLSLPAAFHAARHVQPVPVPAEMRSTFFTVTVNGRPVDVAHAASSYDYVSFDMTAPVEVAITANEKGFWDRGVDLQPWRLGLRAAHDGDTIRFRLTAPAKLSIARPDDFLNRARMLFLFAGSPPAPSPAGPHVRVIPAGVHRESLNPKSGDTIYLEPGAYLFGSLNLWNVQNVKVLGRGTIVYDGPQAPNADEGWMQKPDWHCIGAYEAHDVQISGLTCIVRSRTWSIQMKDSTGFTYDDLRVVGGNIGNANQDGMDWLGGGDAVVRNAFIRSSDDVFAMQGNWDGYTEDDMLRPGKDVRNILIEHSELSTSISNIVRAGWPQKTFNSSNFTLRDSDILHAGIGACGQSFALLDFWGAHGARGTHSGYTFENLFLDNWYSLMQMEQEQPALRNFTFRNIWALGQPPLAESTLTGDVAGVTLSNVKYGQTRVTNDAQVPLSVTGGAAQPRFAPVIAPVAAFTVSPAAIAPRRSVTFIARRMPGAKYTWRFGDGTEAHGRRVRHRFADAEGTELDGTNGAGMFRVLLHVEDKTGHEDWAEQDVTVVSQWQEATKLTAPVTPGLTWKIYPGAWTELPDLSQQQALFAGHAAGLEADAHGFTRYATAWDGLLHVPAEGGYTFYLISRDGARLVIDGKQVAKTGPPFSQVCGSPGNAVRYARGSLGLRAGWHNIHLEGLHSNSEGWPRLMWEGPGMGLSEVAGKEYASGGRD